MGQAEANVGWGGGEKACPSKEQNLSWWEKSQRKRCSPRENPRAGPGPVPCRWQLEAASRVCPSSEHRPHTAWLWWIDPQGSSCLQLATQLAAATQTHRLFPGCQAVLEKPGRGVGGFQPEPWAVERSPTIHPLPSGPALSPDSLGFSQAFIELLLCARPCARLCLTQSLPQEHRELTQSFAMDWTAQPSRVSVFSPPPGCSCPVFTVLLKLPEVTLPLV